jgi:hypothetical protein
MPFVTGNKIAIINVYDGCITLTDAPTIFSDYTVNGVTYSSVNDLQSALLDVIYTRNSLTNAAITLTTIGNSGAATLTGITLNIPNYIGGTGATNFLPKFTGASTLGNSLIFDNGTNVGIGTTSPARRLHIVSDQSSIPDLCVQGADIGQGWLGFGTTNDYSIQAGTDYTAMVFRANNTERMRITSTGNVGIGTTSPAHRLDVNGNVLATSFIRSGGTSTQFLKADGSVDSSTFAKSAQSDTTVWRGTQAQYDAIGTKSSTTLYFIN